MKAFDLIFPSNLKNWVFGCAKALGLTPRKSNHITHIDRFTIDQSQKLSQCQKISSRLGIYRFLLRFRYPVSLPEDIAGALGVDLNCYLTFQEFVQRLQNPNFRPTRLKKFMPRELAEDAFSSALRVDRFGHKSLFAYYFNEGWLEFVLQFDEQARLRRVYLQHKYISDDLGLEIVLN